MTPRYIITPEAKADLEEIGDYIARDNPIRAGSFIAEIEATCQKLAATPYMGRMRDELRHGLRYFGHGEYLILYRPAPQGVDIVRIIHGRRDLAKLV